LSSTCQKVAVHRTRDAVAMDDSLPFDLKSFARQIGVTRIADLTGLDRIGYPVAAAIRPLSRNLSVHFGKGPTANVARLSAVMEAAELFYSQHQPAALHHGRYCDYPEGTACDPATLAPELDDSIVRTSSMCWANGYDLQTGARRLVPWQTTCMDFTTAARKVKRQLGFGATGLAAGFSEEQAVLHGLLEVIERNAHDAWNDLDDDDRLQTRLDINTCRDPATAAMLDMITRAQLTVFLWDMTDHTGIPCYLAELCDFADDAATAYSQGAAAHLDANTAIRKALGEAIQVRLTYIAGGRDDLDWSDYGKRYSPILESRRSLLAEHRSLHRWPSLAQSIPFTTASLRTLVNKLGPTRPVTVMRLSRADEPVVVVKIIVPHMADTPDADSFAEAIERERAVAP
jgi:YcaO-like protein with predicted kinase domain